MKKLKEIVYGGLIVLIFLLIGACSDDSPGTARVEVRLTDSPADYQEVNVDIQDVQVHSQGGDPASGWQSLSINKGVYNLLELTNGLDTLLGSVDLPEGKLSQVRLVLGDNNSLRMNNQSSALNVPSSSQSGLKIQVHEDLFEGITYKILLDFDAARSIVSTGSGKFNLKPVIRSITQAQDGAIKGAVNPVSASPVVYAIQGTDTVSTYTDDMGKFLVKGLAPATYRVVLVPTAGATVEKTNVIVTIGKVTDLGTINF